jgi:hypothetical protein
MFDVGWLGSAMCGVGDICIGTNTIFNKYCIICKFASSQTRAEPAEHYFHFRRAPTPWLLTSAYTTHDG